MKRKQKWEGRIDTVGDAAMADLNVSVTCSRCGHTGHMYAWRLANAAKRGPEIPLGVSYPGFKCKFCRNAVEAVVLSIGPFAG